MLNVLKIKCTDFSKLDYETDTCFLHSMLHINFDLKKDFIEIWI